MSGLIIFGLFLSLFVGSIIFSIFAVKRGMKPAKAIVTQICSFVLFFILGCYTVPVIAASSHTSSSSSSLSSSTTEENNKTDKEWDSLAMALVVGLASIGSGIAVAAAAPAAIGATSEDPKSFGKAIVFVGLAEGVSIFGLLIAIFIKFV